MKDDEKWFLAECQRCVGVPPRQGFQQVFPRDLLSKPGYPIPAKRGWYLLGKWAGRGWYEYGCAIDLGWMTPAGMRVATAATPAVGSQSGPGALVRR